MLTDMLKKPKSELMKSALPLIYLVIALFALRWSVVEPYVVPTGSMEPTLKPGDRLYALKCAYDVRIPFTDKILFRTGAVKRGDVILFMYPEDPKITFVKRAIGLPGDRVEFREGVLYVNGEEVQRQVLGDRGIMYDIENEEDKTVFIEQLGDVKHYMILDNLRPSMRTTREIIVPPDHLLAIGDNRDNSKDSRYWGFVPFENLKGRAMFIWYSSRNFTGVRPERIGTLIQ